MAKNCINKTDKISQTLFLEKYGGLSLYDEYLNKISTIYYKDIKYVNNYGIVMIENAYKHDGTSTDHEYYPICDDFFTKVYKRSEYQNFTSDHSQKCVSTNNERK